MPDVRVTSDLDSSGVKAGLNEFRSHVKAVAGEVSGTFAGMFAAGSIVAFGKSLFGVAEHIDNLSRRFAVSRTAIQEWGNAAQVNGIEAGIDGVAAAFNKLEIARSKALGGNDGLVKSFASLNITIEDLRTLSPDELLRRIGSSSMNAADLVKVLGRSAIALRPLLQGVADGSITLGKAMDDGTIRALAEANVTFKSFGQTMTVFGGTLLGGFIKAWQVFVNDIVVGALASKEALVGLINVADRLLHVDFKGAIREARAGASSVADQVRTGAATNTDIARGELTAETAPTRSVGAAGGEGSAETDDNGNAVIGRDRGGSTAGGSSGSNSTALYERLAKIERERYLDSLSKEKQIEAIARERGALQSYLNNGKRDGTISDEKAAETQLQIYDRDTEIHKINLAIVDAKTQAADAQTKLREEAAAHYEQQQAELTAAREQTAELRQTAAGHADVAQQMRTQFEFQQKINAARKDGNEALAKELESQRDITRQMQQQAAAQKAAAATEAARAANAKHWSDGMQDAVDNLGSYDLASLAAIAALNPGNAPGAYTTRTGATASTTPYYTATGAIARGYENQAAPANQQLLEFWRASVAPQLQQQTAELKKLNQAVKPKPGGA